MKTFEEVLKEDLDTAQWVGEDGSIIAYAKTEDEAWEMMQTLMRECCGDMEAEEMKKDDLGKTFLHLVTDQNKSNFEEDVEWYVDATKESEVKVWYYAP